MSVPARITVLGRGAAALSLAQGFLHSGAKVVHLETGTQQHGTTALSPALDEAMGQADLVVVQDFGRLRSSIAEGVVPLLREGAVFADLTAGTPAAKKNLAESCAEGVFVDVAALNEHALPIEPLRLVVAGPGAGRFTEMLAGMNVNVEYVSDVPGDAASRGLLSDLLAKGLAGVVVDCLWAAERMGLQDWGYREILDWFDTASAETVAGHVSRTAYQVKRQELELLNVAQMLRDSEYDSPMIAALQFNYGRILHGTRVPFSRKP
ncbi:hypothetical protein [Paenarthrobacter nitroguajacolicus]|uniref:hypothetical protein n=1 Tax=Paenarthrobacter nitroguajacolicus TaxID=211146 RepID=UPI0028542B4A|nr:hypothetical protein [Paenarthrobacter nitroguajacolicus]MDR6639480.1 3-hydroxyisobutyrate dehydrogenase-like beta-hydroxyacid dehydrogenase [Paenarthrobacter nitroguajacolicus]